MLDLPLEALFPVHFGDHFESMNPHTKMEKAEEFESLYHTENRIFTLNSE